MSDNTRVLNPGTLGPGDTLRTIDESGVKTQVVALSGRNGAGLLTLVPCTSEGHVEVAIHGPRLPFGSIHTESLTPVFQADGVYGVNPDLMVSTTGLAVGVGAGSGSVSATDNKLICSTGTTQYSFASLQSRRRLRYRPGQGVIARYTALFSAPAASSIVVAGVGTAESGFFFGYNGTSFGVLHSTGGVRELHTMTITTASTATNDYVVTLPNGATVNVTATANGTTAATAYEISKGNFPGWAAEPVGSTVLFLAASSGPKTGTFTLAQTGAGTPAAGTDVETRAGVASTDTWVSQADWNGDIMDGSGSDSNPSGATLDPSKGNVYQIGVQYLGFGPVVMYIEARSGENNADFVPVHTFSFANTLTTPHSSQPAFPFTMSAYSAGSTTDVSVSTGSFAGFVEGPVVNLGPRSTYLETDATTSSTSAYTPIFTVRNSLVYAGRANQSVIRLIDVLGAAKSNTGLTAFILIRDAALSGPVSFSQYDSTQSSSLVDYGATSCTFSKASQVVWSGQVSESGQVDHTFDDRQITLQPGESITLAVRSVTATAVCVGSLNTREDQ